MSCLLQEELCTVILEAYVERLIESDQKRLIAHYVSHLPTPRQVGWYAHFLEGEWLAGGAVDFECHLNKVVKGEATEEWIQSIGMD